MINFFKKNIELLVIFLFSLTPLLWLKGNEVIIGHDSGFRLNYLDHLINLFYSWNSIQNFGTDWGILKGFLIVQLPETFFSLLFGSLTLGQRATFVMWFFIIGLSMYIFVRNFFYQKEFWIMRLFSSTFYMYNFFLLQAWFIAERAKFSLFAALPLGTLIIYKTLLREYSIVKGVMLFSVVSFFLNGGGSPPLFGSLILVYLITFTFLTFRNVRRKGVGEIVHSLRVGLFFLLGFVAINSYFVLPHLYGILNKYEGVLSSVGGISGILAWENAINKFASFINLFRLQGIPDWYDNPRHPYSDQFTQNPLLITLSFFPIFIIVLGLIHHQKFDVKKRKDGIFYLALSIFVIGLVFAAGSHPPFGFIYVFLVEHLPGFAIFRSAFYKFGPVFWFSAIFLTGYYLNLLILRYVKKDYLNKVLGVSAIVFVLLYHFPYFKINFFEFSKPFTTKNTIPAYVEDSMNYLNQTPSKTRTLVLPKLDPSARVDSYTWGFWGLESLPKLSLNHSVVANDNVSPEVVNIIYKSIDQGNSLSTDRLLGNFGINKIIWRNDVLYNDRTTTSKDVYLERDNINNVPSISLEKTFDKWEIYDVKSPNFLPIFYSPKKIISSDSLKPYEDLLLAETDPRFSAIFSIETENSLKGEVISRVSSKQYLEPSCVLCKDEELEAIKKGIFIPKVNFLPGSLLYFLKIKRENLSLMKSHELTRKLNLDIFFSNNRIAEISGVLFKDEIKLSSKTILIEKLIKSYKNLISDSAIQLKNMPPSQRNHFYIQLLSHLEVQRSFLNKLHYRDGFPEEYYLDLAGFIDRNIENIEKEIFMSTSINNKRLSFNITEKGSYDIEFLGEEPRPARITLDDKKQIQTKNIDLNTGEHRLELFYENPNLFILDQIPKEFAFKNNEKKIFKLSGIKPADKYTLSYEYKITEGDNSLIQAGYEKSHSLNSRFDLNRDIQWKIFSIEFEYNPISPNVDNFVLKNISKESNTTLIRNLRLSKVFIPKVYITKERMRKNFGSPELSIQKINPVEFVVGVKNAKIPYVLNFSESFDSGWKVYIVKSKDVDSSSYVSAYFGGAIKEAKPLNKFFNNLSLFFKTPLDESKHFKVNGYSNAWYIEEPGDYKLIVFFEPQKYFYIGLIISALTILGFLILVLKRKYGRN